MKENIVLVATRLVEMTWHHPFQDNTHICSECSNRVGIYPSGQKVIKTNRDTVVVCTHCAIKNIKDGDIIQPAASVPDIIEEMRDSIKVGKV